MSPKVFPLLSAVFTLGFAACSTAPRRSSPGAMVVEATVQPAIPVQPAEQVLPARVAVVDDSPIPVWKPTRIVKVRVAPYFNERGEAFPETYKYVVAEEGSWNIAALQNPERAYIPSENTQKPVGAPGAIFGTISPGTAGANSVSPAVPTRTLYDMSQIRLTGLFDRKDESKARAEGESVKSEVGPYTVGYDADLGWIILPQTAILPNPDSAPGTALPARVPAVKPKTAAGDKDIK